MLISQNKSLIYKIRVTAIIIIVLSTLTTVTYSEDKSKDTVINPSKLIANSNKKDELNSKSQNIIASIPILPWVKGFGRYTVAGSGRHLLNPKTSIVKVTSLLDEGAGTLRKCLEMKGPRTCIFEIGGEITLKDDVTVKNPFLTVAGETSPNPGILVKGGTLKIATHDVLFSHLEWRIGTKYGKTPPESRDNINIISSNEGTYNIVLEHLSLSWSVDENISFYSSKNHPQKITNVTIQDCIISEGLNRGVHPKGNHSMGMLINAESRNISILNNIFAHNDERNPRIKPGAEVELVNNLIYNWGYSSKGKVINISDYNNTNEPLYLRIEGNIAIPGPDSKKNYLIFGNEDLSASSMVFLKDNLIFSPKNNEFDIEHISNLESEIIVPFPPISTNFKVMEAKFTESYLLKNAGSRPYERNIVDKRTIDDIKHRSGHIKDCVSGCKQKAMHNKPPNKSKSTPVRLPKDPFGDKNNNGYTNLEEWTWGFLPQSADIIR